MSRRENGAATAPSAALWNITGSGEGYGGGWYGLHPSLTNEQMAKQPSGLVSHGQPHDRLLIDFYGFRRRPRRLPITVIDSQVAVLAICVSPHQVIVRRPVRRGVHIVSRIEMAHPLS
jgi:hypothetical protein